jgi:hypothetical protein
MSLFENDQYRWRETYFVLFHEDHRPTLDEVVEALEKLGKRYHITDKRDTLGRFESVTLVSPSDFAAMDITYTSGEEVETHVQELLKEMRGMTLSEEERAKLKRLPTCNARFDVYHFEQVLEGERAGEEEEFLDPGALLVVLNRLAKLCHGISIDPQSGAVM